MNLHYRTCKKALDAEEEIEEEGEDEVIQVQALVEPKKPQNKCPKLSTVILTPLTFLGATISIWRLFF